VSVSERHVDLVSEGIDLGVRHGNLVDSSLTAKKLTDADFVLVASAGYLAERGVPTRFADLGKHTCVVFAKDRERYPWSLKVGKQIVRYLPQGSVMTGDAEHVRASVLCGLGIAQAPSWLFAAEIGTGEVQVLLPRLQPARVPIHLVYPAGRRVPMRVRVFIDYLVSAFEQRDQR
jgi:LysR family transcriptional regulator for bpeEF and oprC